MRPVFVFGSNREGRHGAGAALAAVKEHGAIYGQASGRQGNSYAIVTKELRRGHPPVGLFEVMRGVRKFLAYAKGHQDETFLVTKVGCGLAGFDESIIRELFAEAQSNCALPEGWRP